MYVCVHALPVLPSLCNVSLVPLFGLGPSLVQCERKAWEDVKGNGESHPFQGPERGAGGGGATHRRRWEPAPECWLWTQEGEGIKGAIVQDEGGGKGDMQTQICPHRQPHAHPGTPRQIQGQELLDTPTWGQGKRRLPLHSGAQRGWTHPRETKSRETACAHTHAQGHREMLSHTGARRVAVTIACMHACVRACIHSNCTLPRNYKRPCHSRAHMRSHVPSLAVIVACHDSHCHSVKQKTQLHINTCVHNLATSIFLDSSVQLRFCRQ